MIIVFPKSIKIQAVKNLESDWDTVLQRVKGKVSDEGYLHVYEDFMGANISAMTDFEKDYYGRIQQMLQKECEHLMSK